MRLSGCGKAPGRGWWQLPHVPAVPTAPPASPPLLQYVEEVLRSRQPLLIFLEEPCAPRYLSAVAQEWLAPVLRAVRDGAVPDVLLVPVGIAYDLAPDSLQGSGAVSGPEPTPALGQHPIRGGGVPLCHPIN